MKKYLKFFCIFLVLLVFTNISLSFAEGVSSPLVDVSQNNNKQDQYQLNNQDKKVLEDFLKMLQDPAKLQALIDIIGNKQSSEKVNQNSNVNNNQEGISEDISNIIDIANEKYQSLGLYAKLKKYFQDFKKDLFNINYLNLSILLSSIVAVVLLLLFIDYIYSKSYNINNYNKDFTKYYKKNYFIKKHILLFLINIRFFLPTILPASFLLVIGKLGLVPLLYSWVINLFVFTIILMMLLRFLKIVFFNIKGSYLYKFKHWFFLLLWLLFVFLSLQYIFSEMKNYAMVKLNIILFILVIIVCFIKLRFLFNKITNRALKQNIRKYKRFFLHVRKYSIVFLYIAVYSYFVSILFLDQSIIKSIVIKYLILLIGVLFIYLIQSYFANILIKNFLVNKRIASSNISKMIFNNATDKNSLEFTFFWNLFNIFYHVIFVFIYILFFNKIIDTNIFSQLNNVLSYKVANIILNVFAAFSFLMVITFFIVFFIERFLLKLAMQGDLVRLKKMLTLYKILQKPYKILFFVILIIALISSLGISLTALVASTGVITIFLAFGMKDILQNFFNSIMFFLENSFSLNDYIDLGGVKGTVEEISMVYIKIRDTEGNLIMIPFRDVSTIINYSKDYSYAMVEVGVAYNTNIDKVYKLLAEISQELREDKDVGGFVSSNLEILGVVALADSSVNVRCKIKTVPGKQFPVKTLFLRKIHDTFMKEGIDIPFPQTVVTIKNEK